MKTNQLYLFLFVLILKLFVTPSLQSQTINYEEIGNYNITNYTPKEYNAQAQNFAITQDNRGIMYFGNNAGILEFDGKNWKLIKVSNESSVNSLLYDTLSRKIYVGANNEIGYLEYSNKRGISYRSLLQKEKNIGLVRKITSFQNHTLFQGSNNIYDWNGVNLSAILDSNHSIQIDRSIKLGTNYLIIDSKNDMFLLERNNISVINNDKTIQIRDILQIDTTTYILTKASGLFTSNNQVLKNLDTSILNPFKEDKLQNILQNANANELLENSRFNSLIISTSEKGIIVTDRNKKSLKIFDQKNGMYSNFNQELFQDKEGNLWCATANGISKIEFNSPISKFDESYGYKGTIEAITRFNKKIYAATHTGIYSLEKNEANSQFQIVKGDKIKTQCWDLLPLQNSSNTNLLAISNNGVHEIDKRNKAKFILPAYAYVLYQSKLDPNRVFVGLEKGISSIYWTGKFWKDEGKIAGITNRIFRIEEDNTGNLYLGTQSQSTLIKVKLSYQNESLEVANISKLDTSNGLPEGDVLIRSYNKDLILGTNNGIYDLLSDSLISNHKINSLLSADKKAIHRLSADPNKNLWIISYGDSKNEINLVKNNDGIYTVIKSPFTQIQKGVIHAIHHDEDGVTWLGGTEGLYRYDSNIQKDYERPYPTLIRKVQIGEDSTLFHGTFADTSGTISSQQPAHAIPILTYANNDLTFHYAGISYEQEQENLYSHFLEGYDKKWSEWTNEAKRGYTNLDEGEYTFRVKCKNAFNHISEEAIYKFTILPPWYRTVWAYCLWVILAIGFVWGTVQFFTRSLQAVIKERTAEIQQKNEYLEQQKTEIEEKNSGLEKAYSEISIQKEIIEEKNLDIMASIQYAKKIQTAILPQEELRKEVLPNSFVFFQPKDVVSGDFYWISQKENTVLWTAADCTGHGVPGAFMSMIGTSLLNETVNEKGITQPAKILDYVKEGVIKSLKQGEHGESKDGMDAALCSLDKTTNILQFAGGNNPVYIIRKGEQKLLNENGEELTIEPNIIDGELHFYEIKADKMPLAYYPSKENPFTNHTVQLIEGDSVYVASDGFPDQFGGPKGKKFKYKAMKELLLKINHQPLEEQKNILITTITDWMGSEHEQIDDICIIGVKV